MGALGAVAGTRALAGFLRERRDPFLIAAIAAALLLMGMTLFVRTREDTYPYRYFLPLATILVMLVASLLTRRRSGSPREMLGRYGALATLFLLCLTSTASLAEFRRTPLTGQQYILEDPTESRACRDRRTDRHAAVLRDRTVRRAAHGAAVRSADAEAVNDAALAASPTRA